MSHHVLIIMLTLFMASSCTCGNKKSSQSTTPHMPIITPLHGHPTHEPGIERGVSACYTAIVDDHLIMAGGCNFPSQEDSDNLNKRFYRGIYAAPLHSDSDSLCWSLVGQLPEPSAYGAYVTMPDGMIIVGGQADTGSLSSVVRVRFAHGDVQITSLPSFPHTVDNAAAAIVGDTVYVVGGNMSGQPSASIYSLSLQKPENGWTHVAELPDGHPRVQPVCAGVGDELFVAGGFCPSSAQTPAMVHVDGHIYNTVQRHWQPVPAPADTTGTAFTLSGGVAAAVDGQVLCAGGVNQQIFLDAISGAYTLTTPEVYPHHPAEWYKFNPHLVAFAPSTLSWHHLATSPSLSRAGASMAVAGDTIYYVGGELKPRVRTPEVVRIQFQTMDQH